MKVVKPSSVVVVQSSKNASFMRHVRSPENIYPNISIPWNAAKYTRVFDSRLQFGSRKKLRIDRIKWSTPMKNESRKIEISSDGSILYLNVPRNYYRGSE